MKYLLETLPGATTRDLEALLPWSESLPEVCYAMNCKERLPVRKADTERREICNPEEMRHAPAAAERNIKSAVR